jgi:hypothetical protein
MVADDTNADQPIGFNLGSDYVAEHEWGIKDLCRIFGIVGPEYVCSEPFPAVSDE